MSISRKTSIKTGKYNLKNKKEIKNQIYESVSDVPVQETVLLKYNTFLYSFLSYTGWYKEKYAPNVKSTEE